MQMVTTKTDNMVVSVFYDIQGQMTPLHKDKERLNILMHAVKAAFEKKYAVELSARRKGADAVTPVHHFTFLSTTI
jgi:hypothetical protein